MVLQSFLFNNCSLCIYADTPQCPGGDSDITIIGPANEDMFMSGKGKIVCQVLENKPSVLSVLWQDENGHTLIEYSKSTDNGKKVINLALDITYDEWNQGIKRYCVVEHSEWLEPVKKIYERSIGKKTIQQLKVCVFDSFCLVIIHSVIVK